ncbi:MAG: hypothetical protein SGPRY_013043, partial [Prymnesium sp.]
TPWPAPARKLFSSAPPSPPSLPDPELAERTRRELARREEERKRREDAAQQLLRATLGLDRGALASASDAARVEAAVGRLQHAAPCKLEGLPLVDALQGTSWRLVYTSSLVDGSHPASKATPRGLRSLRMNLLVDVPAMQSPVGLGAVWQSYRRSGEDVRLEDCVSLRLPAPWPLPRVDLRTTFSYNIKPTGTAGGLLADLEEVIVESRPSLSVMKDRRFAIPAPRRLLERVLGEGAKLPPPLASLPPAQQLERLEEGAGQLSCLALVKCQPADVLVLRSALGDIRVFVADAISPSPSDDVPLNRDAFYVPSTPTPTADEANDLALQTDLSAQSETLSQTEPDSTMSSDAVEEDEEEIWIEGVSDWNIDDAAGLR